MKINEQSSCRQQNYFELNTDDNNEFAARSNDIFCKLDKVEARHQHFVSNQDIEPSCSSQKKEPVVVEEEIVSRRGFRRPHERGSKAKGYRRNMPRFKADPHKWKKYSLADVSDMSESSNTKAALSFLNELKQRKNDKNEKEPEESYDEKLAKPVVFHKPSLPVHTSSSSGNSKNNTAVCKGSKFCMPEYVIGKKFSTKHSDEKSVAIKSDIYNSGSSNNNINAPKISDNYDDEANDDSETQISLEPAKILFKSNKKKVQRSLRKRSDED